MFYCIARIHDKSNRIIYNISFSCISIFPPLYICVKCRCILLFYFITAACSLITFSVYSLHTSHKCLLTHIHSMIEHEKYYKRQIYSVIFVSIVHRIHNMVSCLSKLFDIGLWSRWNVDFYYKAACMCIGCLLCVEAEVVWV